MAVVYWFWLEECHSRNGFYPYPLLEQMGFWERVALWAGSVFAMGSVGVVLGMIGRAGRVIKEVEEKKRI